MKKIKILLLVLNISYFYAVGNSVIPRDIAANETIKNVELKYPNYHFKFYKKLFDGDVELSFGMLGYWHKGSGCVLFFTEDKYYGITLFKDINKYKNYITNPKEKANIKINKKNIVL